MNDTDIVSIVTIILLVAMIVVLVNSSSDKKCVNSRELSRITLNPTLGSQQSFFWGGAGGTNPVISVIVKDCIKYWYCSY